jgi:hypothetical protein
LVFAEWYDHKIEVTVIPANYECHCFNKLPSGAFRIEAEQALRLVRMLKPRYIQMDYWYYKVEDKDEREFYHTLIKKAEGGCFWRFWAVRE